MKNVLLLDTNLSSLPIYDYLVTNEYNVYVIGGNPDDFLAKYSKNYINLDYQDIHKVEALINEKKIDFLVPGCNDVSYFSCSKLRDRGFLSCIDTYETTTIINNKEKFRFFAQQNKLSVPKIYNSELTITSFPVIVKPVDAYSGRGITIVNNSEEVISAIQNAKSFSSSSSYIIEDYISGQLYSHSAFISDGKIFLDFIVKEFCSTNEFAVDTSHVEVSFNETILSKIRNQIQVMVDKLKLVDGLIHTQFILKEETFWIIEVTRRCPGDLYSKLINFSTGIKYAELYTLPFLGIKYLYTSIEKKQNFILRHTISLAHDSSFCSLKFKIPLMIRNFFPLNTVGNFIKKSPFDRIGIIFMSANSQIEMSELLLKTLNKSLYDVNN